MRNQNSKSLLGLQISKHLLSREQELTNCTDLEYGVLTNKCKNNSAIHGYGVAIRVSHCLIHTFKSYFLGVENYRVFKYKIPFLE